MTTSLERAAVEVRETCLGTKLRMASRAVTQLYDDAIAESGIRSTQFSLLVALAQAPLVPLSKIAEALVMDRTTLTRNLMPLVREGLVKEGRAADKRVRAYALTAQGKQVLERALPGWRKAQAELKRVLSGEDREQLDRLLKLTVHQAKRV
jgi:DNA-binding MarR family transcriptional regulator